MSADQEIKGQWEAFHKTLDPYPHSFQLEDQDRLTVSRCRDVLHTVQSDFNSGLPTSLERAGALNFMCFLHCQLGEKSQALDDVKRALSEEGQEKNIVSLANKAVVLWRQDLREKAEEQVKEMKCLQLDEVEFEYLVARAKAELACSYNNIAGEHFWTKASALYLEAIKKAREPEVHVWMFGLALTERRALYQRSLPLLPNTSEDNKRLDVLQKYLNIIKRCQCDRLRAKSYGEVAHLIDNRWGSKSQKQLEDLAGMTRVEACLKAIELDPEEPSVLWKSGKIFRHENNLTKSYDLLKKCIRIKPTTTAYHHLGLTCKKLAKEAKRNVSSLDAPVSSPDVPVSSPDAPISSPDASVSSSDASVRSQGALGKAEKAVFWNTSAVLPSSGDRGARAGTLQEEDYGADEPSKHDINVLRGWLRAGRLTPLCAADPYVEEAVSAFEEAVRLSEGQNAPAVADLGFLYHEMGKLGEALDIFRRIINTPDITYGGSDFYKINAYEQVGLILKDMSQQVEDEERKKQLVEQSESNFSMAFRICARLCRQQQNLGPFVPHVTRSFLELLRSTETSKLRPVEKDRKIAKLYQLIENHKESMKVLRHLFDQDQNEENNPETLKIKIKNLVGLGQYDEALKAIGMVRLLVEQSREDDRYFVWLNMQAGRNALCTATTSSSPIYSRSPATMTGVANNTFSNAGSYFSEAFRVGMASMMAESERETSSSEEFSESEPSHDEDEDSKSWDVLVLSEEDVDEQARAVAKILEEICGLRVTVNSDDCLPGTYILDSMARAIRKRCRQVLVLISTDTDSGRESSSCPGHRSSSRSRSDSASGGKSKNRKKDRKKGGSRCRLSSSFGFYLEHAASRCNTVVLMLGGEEEEESPGLSVPRSLGQFRRMSCPRRLLGGGTSDTCAGYGSGDVTVEDRGDGGLVGGADDGGLAGDADGGGLVGDGNAVAEVDSSGDGDQGGASGSGAGVCKSDRDQAGVCKSDRDQAGVCKSDRDQAGVCKSDRDQAGAGGEGQEIYGDPLVQEAICDLFSFLVNVKFEEKL